MITNIIALAAIALLVAADQITKLLISSNYEVGETTHVIGGVLDFTYVQNRGAAFGMLSNQRWIFLLLTTAIIIGICWLWVKGFIDHITGQISAVLIVAGGIGNMIDRLAMGYVVDFIDVNPLFDFAVFNVADCCVTVGAAIMAVYVLFFLDENKLNRAMKRSRKAVALEEADSEDNSVKDAGSVKMTDGPEDK